MYLDNNSTTRPLQVVTDAVLRTMKATSWNPSSAHSLGVEARTLLEAARDGVCALLPGIFPEGVIFTSGGTEGNNLVIGHHAEDAGQWTLITTKVEHPSILRPAEALARRGARIILLDVSASGTVNPADAARAARETIGPVKVSIQWANSETGVVQPVANVGRAVKAIRPDALVHSDIAQAVGRVPVDLVAAGVDVATFSGHKLHGPQGSGVLVLTDPDDRRVSPLILGGGQEQGMRSGTQNVAAAVGLGRAAEVRAAHLEVMIAKMAAIRDCFERAILKLVPEAVVNGSRASRVPNTSNIRFPGIEGMALLAKLDEKGVAASLGSACSSGKPSPSHVLTAMQLSEDEAYASLRFSFSIFNTQKEVRLAAQIVADCLRDLQ
ncbi:cysteine desulfurase family protein, partial [Pararhodospirillum photometricum]|uniref:cysteine desulfurase family protein n=1 Tax=Pararhodospirillum photometricum TaxID=1084 RepID=UPI0005A10410